MPLFEDDARAEAREQRHELMSSSHRHDRIEVPALQLAGWYDLCLQPDLDHFTAMRERAATHEARRLTRILVGRWAHAGFAGTVGMLDFGMRATGIPLDLREDLTGLHRRWFDARLRGQRTGIDDEPPVRLFVMGRNRWRGEDEWPLRRARGQSWYPTAGGGRSRAAPAAPPGGPGTAEPAVFTLDPDDPVPTTGGTLLMHPAHLRGPVHGHHRQRDHH